MNEVSEDTKVLLNLIALRATELQREGKSRSEAAVQAKEETWADLYPELTIQEFNQLAYGEVTELARRKKAEQRAATRQAGAERSMQPPTNGHAERDSAVAKKREELDALLESTKELMARCEQMKADLTAAERKRDAENAPYRGKYIRVYRDVEGWRVRAPQNWGNTHIIGNVPDMNEANRLASRIEKAIVCILSYKSEAPDDDNEQPNGDEA